MTEQESEIQATLLDMKKKAEVVQGVVKKVKGLVERYSGPVSVFQTGRLWFDIELVGSEKYRELMWEVDHNGKDWLIGTYAPGSAFRRQDLKSDIEYAINCKAGVS